MIQQKPAAIAQEYEKDAENVLSRYLVVQREDGEGH